MGNSAVSVASLGFDVTKKKQTFLLHIHLFYYFSKLICLHKEYSLNSIIIYILVINKVAESGNAHLKWLGSVKVYMSWIFKEGLEDGWRSWDESRKQCRVFFKCRARSACNAVRGFSLLPSPTELSYLGLMLKNHCAWTEHQMTPLLVLFWRMSWFVDMLCYRLIVSDNSWKASTLTLWRCYLQWEFSIVTSYLVLNQTQYEAVLKSLINGILVSAHFTTCSEWSSRSLFALLAKQECAIMTVPGSASISLTQARGTFGLRVPFVCIRLE